MCSKKIVDNDLVRYSRAGDAFHYRWAARRCLRLVNPLSKIKQIVIEGSKESPLAGEYNIDVSEYRISNENEKEEVFYFQLKHSTKRVNKPYNLSDLKSTIEGFAERFNVVRKKKDIANYKFILITNRSVKKRVKECIQNIINGNISDKRLRNTLERYTGLRNKKLRQFCRAIELKDGEGGYVEQKYSLHTELSEIVAGTVDNTIVDSLISFVGDQALPNSNGLILKEDVLKRFGVSSEMELLPAVSEVEDVSEYLKREQHDEIINVIKDNVEPVIIYASGGIGKSVLAHQLVSSLSGSSHGLVYDCFDSGRYRARSSSRHRHKTAFTQIINEMAIGGFCEPLIPSDQYHDETMMKRFLISLDSVSKSIRKSDPDALCYVFIDAADNAEMAAKEFNEPCFANQILREAIPEGCRIVLLCRPERKELLKPPSSIQSIELQPFSQNETKKHLLYYFPNATQEDVLEFHRLSSQNPRVQANALGAGKSSIQELLESLGPSPTTVDEQISDQLKQAVNKIKDELPVDFQSPIDAICIGLANLPPLVPIHVLAKASDVKEDLVKSFVLDIGRPLWIGENAVQFRDEPTETWFRENFSASNDQIIEYIERLKSLALEIPYVSEALPSLLHSSGNYSELIELALSENFLPEDNPIDARNIRVYRLRFAFKAALIKGVHKDATILAFRAGEEIAGESRQLDLLSENIDLIRPLQSEEKVQELAFRRQFKGTWEGCENIFSASLLSSLYDFKGEARSFLRAANNWLQIYFTERDKTPEEDRYNEDLQDSHLVEMAMSYLNIFGVERLVKFLKSWKPKEVVFRITKEVVKRLIDKSRFELINEVADIGKKDPYLIIGLTQSLLEAGHFPPKEVLILTLNSLTNAKKRIKKPDELQYFKKNDFNLFSILSFLEACAFRDLDQRCIYKVLKYYFSERGSVLVNSQFQVETRELFLRQSALRYTILNKRDPNFDQMTPERWVKEEENHRNRQDIKDFKEIIGALLPWYMLRVELLFGLVNNFKNSIEETELLSTNAMTGRYRVEDYLPDEIAKVKFSILALNQRSNENFLEEYYQEFERDIYQLKIKDRLDALRIAFRLESLSEIREDLLKSCSHEVQSFSFENSSLKTEYLVCIARAVLPVSKLEASAYFDLAIESVSKFGDEIVIRWEAVADIAKQSTPSNSISEELAYRFIRCVELVGDYVTREKYLNRNEAVRIGINLHPQSTIAALSRWRDRDVGWFNKQIVAMATESVKSGILNPRVGFSLSAFNFDYGDFDHLKICLEKEKDQIFRGLMLDLAVKKFRINNYTEKKFWVKVKQLAEKHSLQSSELDEILKFYEQSVDTSNNNYLKEIDSHFETGSDHDDWEKIFKEKNFLSSEEISTAIIAFNDLKESRSSKSFWTEIYKKVSINEAINFFDILINLESVNIYDVTNALNCIPQDWLQRLSIKNALYNFNFLIGQRFASELLNRYTFEYLIESQNNSAINKSKIREGIIQGLSEKSALDNAGLFFGFAFTVAPILSPDDSVDVLNYALNRFELHIEEDFADGRWDEWLTAPESVIECISGFIWAALGSPRAKVRWEAAHCIKLLAEMKSKDVIDSLIKWTNSDSDEAFGSKDFTFYKLHAKLFLFIALSRVAIDSPELVQNQSSFFESNALYPTQHLLIQKFSAQIAISIEEKFPGTYKSDIVDKLGKVGVSPFPVRTDIGYGERVNGYWIEELETENNKELHLAYDFDNYWISPLADVFGIPLDQLLDFAKHILIDEWDVQSEDGLIIDSREDFWRMNQNGRETRIYKSSYPKTDNYKFYLSYHVLFNIAQKLLERMPIVKRFREIENPFDNWLSRHLLTRDDGKWLSDRRDPAPLKRREWILSKDDSITFKKLDSKDFIDGLLVENKSEIWLNVYGDWMDNDGYRVEKYYVRSALVNEKASDSLLMALSTCSDPYDYSLPTYSEEYNEIEDHPFELKGWIIDNYIEKGIDENDPNTADISYPPYSIGQSIVKKLQLKSDSEKRYWYLNSKLYPVLNCEIWSHYNSHDTDSPMGEGKKLSASLKILKKLCKKLNCELIIEVQIRRTVYNSYGRQGKKDEFETEPESKIYIFSKDGRFRDERTNYQLR